MSMQLHTTFAEIKVHTAKCDTCNKHNTLTMYRCMECHQQCCTPCWNRREGDAKHLFQEGAVQVKGLELPTVSDEVTENQVARKAKKQMRERKKIMIISDDESETHDSHTNDGVELNAAIKVGRTKEEAIHMTYNGQDDKEHLPDKDAAGLNIFELAFDLRRISIDEYGISQLLSAAAEVEQLQFRTIVR